MHSTIHGTYRGRIRTESLTPDFSPIHISKNRHSGSNVFGIETRLVVLEVAALGLRRWA